MAPKGQSTNLAFVEAFGGGLDVSLVRQFSVRLFQADLVYATGHEPTQLNQNQFFGPRISAGLIWNIGWKHRPVVVAEKSKKPAPTAAAASSEPAAAASATSAPSSEPTTAPASAAPIAEPAQAEAAPPTPEPTAKQTEQKVEPTAPSLETPKEEPKPTATQVAVSEKPTAEKTSENIEAPKPAEEKPVAETSTEKPAATETIATEKPVESAPKSAPAAQAPPTVQHVGALAFPYDQYPTLLSPKDKRNLDAVASRLKLEPEATAVIVGSGDRYAPKAAAQRAVNSKDYLVKKGIAADRVKVFALPAPPPRSKQPSAKTDLVFVPAGASFEAPSSTPVDEHLVKPQHLHVAHPEWHEK
jgi:outer membrane protein OmpA-like peptidoglycan-associated protein